METGAELPTLDRLFLDLLDLDDAQRQARLEQIAADDPARGQALAALLEADALGERLEAAFALSPESVTLDGYELVRPLGHGGMGMVFLARRRGEDFQVDLALKILPAALSSPAFRRAFLREREILSTLRHPGIARMVDGGHAPDGRPYLVMEYVEGRSITEHCRRAELDLAGRLRLFTRVIAAVEAAHDHLVIHRDLKPSNILVGPSGEVKLLDFGIATVVATEAEAAGPATATRALTPAYASPEQLRGEVCTTRSDIFSLGLILYELLSGQRYVPETADGGDEISVLFGPPKLPSAAAGSSRLGRALRGDLDAIVAKALQPEPARRYPSAAALALDLERHLRGQTLEYARSSPWTALVKLVRAHRWALGSAAAVMLTLAISTAVLYVQRQRLRESEAEAQAVVSFLEDLLRSADYTREPTERSLREVLDAGATRVDDELSAQPRVRARVLRVLGEVYDSLRLPERAIWAFERARGAGDAPEVAAELHLGLARARMRAGDLEASLAHFEAASAGYEAAGEAFALHRADAINGVGVARHLLGDDRGAEAALIEALRARRGHPQAAEKIAQSLLNLGVLAAHRGELATAEALLEEAVTQGSMRHPLPLLTGLAAVKSDRGDPAGARALLEAAWLEIQRLAAHGHPEAAHAWCELAYAHHGLGDRPAAEHFASLALGLAERSGYVMPALTAECLLRAAEIRASGDRAAGRALAARASELLDHARIRGSHHGSRALLLEHWLGAGRCELASPWRLLPALPAQAVPHRRLHEALLEEREALLRGGGRVAACPGGE